MDLSSPQFWIAVAQIIAIDILLGGDNAVVIALACRNLPERQRRLGILWGAAGAIGLRVVITVFAAFLLTIPYLKVVGALLLLWIGVRLILPEEDSGHDIEGSSTLAGAIKTIIIADFVMSLDNVVAVAGAAKGSAPLIVFGLLVSIPIIIWCSRLVLHLIERYPVVIVLGGALLGFIAGEMLVSDPVLEGWRQANFQIVNGKALVGGINIQIIAGILGAIFVVGLAKGLAAKRARDLGLKEEVGREIPTAAPVDEPRDR